MAQLTVCCSKTAVRELMRVAWRTVGSIITRVSADAMAGTDRFANVPRIGIPLRTLGRQRSFVTTARNAAM